jgi:2,3-bisphosphoglycerate-dependent phosphoglycerate mutase
VDHRRRACIVTRLLLIRHAHADTGAPPGVLCGRCDVPLSASGQAQVQEMLRRYGGSLLADVLYTSPLRRAFDTASALAQAWHQPLRVDADLQEIDCGELDGRPITAVERECPTIWARNLAQDDELFAWPGGESYRMFRQRVLAALGRLAQAHRGARVAIVTHAGVIGQTLGSAHGCSAAAWEPFRPRHASLSEVVWQDGVVTPVRFDQDPWY